MTWNFYTNFVTSFLFCGWKNIRTFFFSQFMSSYVIKTLLFRYFKIFFRHELYIFLNSYALLNWERSAQRLRDSGNFLEMTSFRSRTIVQQQIPMWCSGSKEEAKCRRWSADEDRITETEEARERPLHDLYYYL